MPNHKKQPSTIFYLTIIAYGVPIVALCFKTNLLLSWLIFIVSHAVDPALLFARRKRNVAMKYDSEQSKIEKWKHFTLAMDLG